MLRSAIFPWRSADFIWRSAVVFGVTVYHDALLVVVVPASVNCRWAPAYASLRTLIWLLILVDETAPWVPFVMVCQKTLTVVTGKVAATAWPWALSLTTLPDALRE